MLVGSECPVLLSYHKDFLLSFREFLFKKALLLGEASYRMLDAPYWTIVQGQTLPRMEKIFLLCL